MPKYMMFLHEPPEVGKDWTPEEMQRVIERYAAGSSCARSSPRPSHAEPVRRWLAERLRELAS